MHSYVVVTVPVFAAGFQVVGGESSGRAGLGTVVSSITPGGPADLDGSLKPGRTVFSSNPALFPVWVDSCILVACWDNCSDVVFCLVSFCACNRGNIDSGDWLISVNDFNVEGLSNAVMIDILQNVPNDVTLVVSQPKESLYKGKRRNVKVFKLFFS